jgi:hypothetical protein
MTCNMAWRALTRRLASKQNPTNKYKYLKVGLDQIVRGSAIHEYTVNFRGLPDHPVRVN